ncbi:hypothetical protein WOLCODRAFT_167355 [Wolfiporia cocos MD-104 SS10]|uniref:Uncharacterized protein n=1 Tax=Wolfiporia cocos (strain MD-104) TaxID=742152 RepID=A0A2H3JBH3_WOLCO|nr:hypothetical protein WOLCODRAFT_167355 [Wolfiporia cocos MD-104 SS10]
MDVPPESFKGKQRAQNLLEPEDEEERLHRMHETFRKLNATTQNPPFSAFQPPRLRDKTMFAIEPPSDLLSRVQAFLPELAVSNAEISRRAQADPDSVDIENVEGGKQYIEMNLGLGVFDKHDTSSIDTYDADMRDGEHTQASSGSDTSSDTSSDSDSDMSDSDDSSSDISIDDGFSASPRLVKPLPKRALSRPSIMVLGEHGQAETMTDAV